MRKNALGLIEVKGLLASIEAADAAMKAANVTLIGLEKIKNGFVTVKITGDVSAITAAVEAGAEAVNRVGTLISKHVISNPDDNLYRMVEQPNSLPFQPRDRKLPTQILQTPSQTKELGESGKSKTTEELQDLDIELLPDQGEALADTASPPLTNSDNATIPLPESQAEQLEKMTVGELREEAKRLGIVTINNRQVRQAKKAQLVQEITKMHKEGVTT
ncbi:BMC domain-containing protein [Brevibacillus laterosporus]|uniref:Carbon dioxide concentrating mechanism/carboxysome shell protein CcmK n=1 Tax=Brevibacillus laterosporus LMG 15441 TaxID=1042163 RepID=A0A075R6R1_BRELA|nr:BMC domain-containing protein [Brevibacillus laterosporus]AIG26858.1 carbon dioxide concentrating mechanism/carboxysome shell protein CcmK [Brevibacillus laterosporus LMG 15441]RJL14542.1 BMC domain-containing protein [Brevibacillus laterosporus]